MEKPFALDLQPRESLIARMQAFAYTELLHGDYPKAQAIAENVMRRYMVHDGLDGAGYWSGFYFDRFKEECAQAGLGVK